MLTAMCATGSFTALAAGARPMCKQGDGLLSWNRETGMLSGAVVCPCGTEAVQIGHGPAVIKAESIDYRPTPDLRPASEIAGA